MARAAFQVTARAIVAAGAFVLLGAITLPPSGPGCIAAITIVPSGTLFSGQTLTMTDGTIVNPETRFLSRTWSFGDGASEKSTSLTGTTTTHVYVNDGVHTTRFEVRLTERTGLGTCDTSVSIDVSPTSL